MSFAQIGNPDPKYLAATDILIGDMPDINYDFLIYKKPFILWREKGLIDFFRIPGEIDVDILIKLESKENLFLLHES